ncbi:MAG: hypothetical protein AAB910_00150 [Patescibacteria group bacterium]
MARVLSRRSCVCFPGSDKLEAAVHRRTPSQTTVGNRALPRIFTTQVDGNCVRKILYRKLTDTHKERMTLPACLEVNEMSILMSEDAEHVIARQSLAVARPAIQDNQANPRKACSLTVNHLDPSPRHKYTGGYLRQILIVGHLTDVGKCLICRPVVPESQPPKRFAGKKLYRLIIHQLRQIPTEPRKPDNGISE